MFNFVHLLRLAADKLPIEVLRSRQHGAETMARLP
jgi:hypothetical protein